MKLKRFLLRYFPPGIILEYEQNGEVRAARSLNRAAKSFPALLQTSSSRAVTQLRQKAVDLLTLTPDTDVEVMVNQIVRSETLISEHRKPQLRKLIYKL